MNNQPGFISLPITGYIMAGLIAFSGIATYGIYLSLKKQGELHAIIKQRDADLVASQTAYDNLKHERKKVEIITLDNMVIKQEIVKEVVKYRDRVKEVVINAGPESCLNQPLPVELLELLNGAGNNPESRESLPPITPDPRHELTVDAGQNLRGFGTIRNRITGSCN